MGGFFPWLFVGILALIGVIFGVHLYLKYRRQPKKVLTVEPDTCCFCGKEERTRFFCKSCCRRMIWRYAAILSGIGCFPFGAAVGLLIYAFTGNDIAILFSILGCIVLYWTITGSYFAIYHKDTGHVSKIRMWVAIVFTALFFIGFFIGLPTSFDIEAGPDPGNIRFTFREEWWRFKLLLKQLRGRTKIPCT